MSPPEQGYRRQTPTFLRRLDRTVGQFGFSSPLTRAVRRNVRIVDEWVNERNRPFFGHPGWLNPLTAAAFLKFRGESVPFRQARALDSLLRVDEFHRSIGAVSLLSRGTLLGAVRQGTFAGRPFDIDLYVVYEKGIDAYVLAVREFGRRYRIFERRHKCTTLGPAKLRLRAPTKVDVQVLVHNPAAPGSLHPDRVMPHDTATIVWPGHSAALTAQVFGRQFAIPSNYLDLLGNWYGSDWEEPASRQYAVRAPTISHSL